VEVQCGKGERKAVNRTETKNEGGRTLGPGVGKKRRGDPITTKLIIGLLVREEKEAIKTLFVVLKNTVGGSLVSFKR